MTIDKAQLKALAEAATPGPWVKGAPGEVHTSDYEVDGETMCDHIASGFGCGSTDPDDAAFVAAANPATILELLAEIDRLVPFEEAYATACNVRNRLIKENDHLDRLIVANKAISDSFKAERDQLKASLDMESAELAWSDSDGREIQAERDKLHAELAGLRTGYDAQNDVIARLNAENEDLRMRVKEMDLMFGRYLLGMRASVIEWQDGKGADAAMQWIWNGLAGPGELPPPEEKEAQPYFDREVVQIENAQQEVFSYWDRRRAEKAKEASNG